jgi:hypothetical protein
MPYILPLDLMFFCIFASQIRLQNRNQQPLTNKKDYELQQIQLFR